MAKKNRNRAAAAAAGTKSDPNRVERNAESGLVAAGVGAGSLEGVHADWAPHVNSRREQQTRKIFTIVEVVLCCIPVLVIGMYLGSGRSFTSDGLESYFSKDPGFAVSFLAACVQPFVAYLLRLAYRRYSAGDVGYCGGNLIVLLCAEMLLSNIPGTVGMVVLLWRTWKNVSPHFSDWAHERGVGGVLVDLSGGIVVLVLAAICAFANFRLAS